MTYGRSTDTTKAYPDECCGGKCLLRCYPIARLMMCPRSVTDEEVDAAKRAFIAHEERKRGI